MCLIQINYCSSRQNRTILLEVSPSDTIQTVKNKLMRQENIDWASRDTLTFQNTMMQDWQTVRDIFQLGDSHHALDHISTPPPPTTTTTLSSASHTHPPKVRRIIFPSRNPFPVRCGTCNYPISQHWLDFTRRTALGEDEYEIMDSWGSVNSPCCRKNFLTHVDLVFLPFY